MTLTTHGLIGATAARLFPTHPVWGFFLGITSHFLADHIPHWDYHLHSVRKSRMGRLHDDMNFQDPAITNDGLRVAFDMSLGIVLPLLLFPQATPLESLTILLGAIGGILPDPIQVLYFKVRREPLRSIHWFHTWIHAKYRITAPLAGAALQAAIILTCALIAIALSPPA